MQPVRNFKPKPRLVDSKSMQKLCIFVGMTTFSYLGWWAGSQFGGVMTAFFTSGLLSLIGVWAGWWSFRRFFY